MKNSEKIKEVVSELKRVRNIVKNNFREGATLTNSKDLKGLHENFHEAISNLISAHITLDFIERRKNEQS